MRKNVFLKSTLRQPVKSAMLVLVTALITFAFVARASEYLLMKQEIERLGSYYRAVGTVSSTLSSDPWADPSETVAYLEENPYVQTVQTIEYTSAIMQDDIYNADIDSGSMHRMLTVAAYGTLQDWDSKYFYFSVDAVLTGYPEHISAGSSLVVFRGNSYDPSNIELAYERLEKGGRYLVVGYYYSGLPACKVEMVETDGNVSCVMYAALSCASDDSFFIPVSDERKADWSDLEGHRLAEDIRLDSDEYHALNIIPVKDMSTLPIVQDAASGIYLTEGRWLNSEDNEQGSTVCVINEELASRRGLKAGDTLTLMLRDIPSHFGYFLNSSIQNPLEFLERAQGGTDTYEIVGIYAYTSQYSSSYVSNYTYVPASVVPDSFTMTTPEALRETAWGTELFEQDMQEAGGNYKNLPHPRDVSFVLTSPDVAGQFLIDSRDELADLGWEVTLLDNNWSNYQAAAVPMRRSSLLNAAIFTGVFLVTVCLIVFIYYRMRRREIAIARALGVPAKRCAMQASLPLLLLGALGVGAGGALGWQYTQQNAENTLSILSGFGSEISTALSGFWLAVLLGGTLCVMALAAVGGAALLVGRPVLALLQNGTAVVKENRASAPKVPEITPAARQTVSAVSAVPRAAAHTQNGGTVHVLRFVWRHITRSRLRSALTVLLAAGFTAGLAAIQLSIAGNRDRIDWLYENTPVEAELLQASASASTGGFIRQDTINTLMESGYISNAYLEGDTGGAVIRYQAGMESGQPVYIQEENTINKTVRAIASEDIFLSAAGSGGAVTVTYLDGWDGSLFAQEWPKGQFPVVLPKMVYEQFCDRNIVGFYCKTFQVCEVAGYYEGDVASSVGNTDPVLIPLNAYQQLSASRLVYSKAHVTLDPRLNRELDRFTEFVTELSASQGTGTAALRAVIWDEELRTAVAPLENSVELMRVLYPVTLVLSLLVAAGIAVLFVMTSAKEAAIMRVLGTSRLRSRVMLALQTAFTSAAGLVAGLLGVLAYTGRTRPDLFANLMGASVLCALLYLLAAVLGAAASASTVTGRNPLELLQVKE